ncbi:MAG: PEFG-CTERM sorting domain-containing protein [Thaumarchaeota archaeon]|nr:PEFG-CTERM sorting domain-containing protein [Nitrososphaerota archaeon]
MSNTTATSAEGGLVPPAYTTSPGSSGAVSTTTSTSTISVATDKQSYNDGDKITVSGTTQDYMGDTPLTLILRNPIGNVVKIDQVPVGPDKTFSTSLTAGGALWQAAGTYSIYVQFGGPDRSATTTFQFSGSHMGGNTFPVDGTNSSVTYSITNGKVLDIKADQNSKSLIVSIQSSGDGSLTITMPRSLIDAKKIDGTDDQYFVLNDDQENDQFQETHTTASDRTLQIPFSDGTSQIEIIGTIVNIPEFGTIAVMVLAIAIISIIVVSTRTGLRFTPKM